MLRIALPNKGRLNETARELFADAGLDVRMAGDRALTASLGGEMQALFLRAQDIPEFVADGAADAGVTGWDQVLESGRSLETALDLGFGGCALVVAVREEMPLASLDALAPGTPEPDALAALAATIETRAKAPADEHQSYTRRLLTDRNLRLKKLGEECAELVTALADGDAERAREEGADLVYHALVALRAAGVTLADVQCVLAARAR